MSLLVEIIWPDRLWVSDQVVRAWAVDALCNEEEANPDVDINLEEAIEIVNFYGYATTTGRIIEKSSSEADWIE